MTVRVTVDVTKKFEEQMKALMKRSVFVGIPQDKNARDDGPIKNATLGYINEFGSPAQNIPARPFLIPGVKAAGEKVSKILGKASVDLNGNVDSALDKAGLVAQSTVKSRIVNSVDIQGLSEATIKARSRRKSRRRTGVMKPLIDTGQMLNSITYEIRDN